ncbi:hypothetical protein BDN72DRAFT_896122 [Pluteus cervinus]|uniref:Uncharacterized protein n=1 Tax=Pluteus cervinus TaxID=181527 RepID=A0ACD3AZ57_9AGAR|nr:hypothetical protein BDN72DRAFT_896122 [Pluteus cervinus]
MSRFTRVLSLISLVVTVSAGVMVQRGPVTPGRILNVDPSTIAAASNAVPIDLAITNPNLNTGSTLSRRDILLKKRSNYEQVFTGTGTAPGDRDASIQGTAYLSFTRLDAYDVGACEAFCDGIETCVFINIFYEYNSDATYNPQIKCAAYADIHSAAEKTNTGGQQLLPPPAEPSYIQESEGYAVGSLADPPVPDGYELVFGPTGGANQAPGEMGFAFLDKYDVQACADLCNIRAADPNGGACQYFNIWIAEVNGDPTTYSCVMYYRPTDASTATNTGQGDLQVTYSRGYQRISYLPDGGFEGYDPTSPSCTASYASWVGTSPSGGHQDASICSGAAYGPRSGHSVGLLGSVTGADNLLGTLAPAELLNTEAGKDYWITFFQKSTFALLAVSTIDVQWNGVTVLHIGPELIDLFWTYYQVKVTAAGSDQLSFHGGGSPVHILLDDVYVWLA